MSLNILLVEDNAEIVELIKNDFCHFSKVFIARNKLEAELEIKSKTFDLIISDYDLGNGHNAINIIRSNSSFLKNAKIILISGFLSIDIIDEAEKLGIKIILKKPLDLEILSKRIQSLFPEKYATLKF